MRYLLPLLLLLPTLLTAQEPAPEAPPPKHRYLTIGPGISLHSVRDLGMSRMVYSGPAFTAYTGYHARCEKFHSDIDIHFSIGGLDAPAGPEAGLYEAEVAYSYQRAVLVLPWEVQWLGGGALSNAASVRHRIGYSNSAYAFDYFTGLHAMSSLWRNFHIRERRMEAGWELSVPVVAFAIRPAYAFAAPPPFYDFEEKYLRGAFASFEAASWGDYFRMQSKLSASYFLRNGNALALTYRWEYYNYDAIPVNELWKASHAFYITTKFNL